MTDFEPVEKGGDSSEMFISVNSNGMFYIPNRVYDQFFDGEDYVDVQKDAQNQRLALRPTRDPDESSTSIYELRDNQGYGKRFSSTAALTGLGVELDESVRLKPIWSDEEEAVVLAFGTEREA